jgi:hypothetical protein
VVILAKSWKKGKKMTIGIGIKLGQRIASMLQRMVVESGKEQTSKNKFYNQRRNLKQMWPVLMDVFF